MGLKKRAGDFVDAKIRRDHRPRLVDEELMEELEQAEPDGRLLRVSPFPENDGIQASEELYQSLHNLKTKWMGLKNVSNPEAFEVWFFDGTVQFFFYVPDEEAEMKFRRQIDAEYPEAKITDQPLMHPAIEVGDHIAGADLTLKQSQYYPIKSSRGVKDFIHDPYRTITSEMVNRDENRVMIQVVFKPAGNGWAKSGFLPWSSGVDEISARLKETTEESGMFSVTERKPTKEERDLADVIATQKGLPAYHINLRVMAVSPDAQKASSNVWSIAKQFEQSYREAGEQQFVQHPLGGSDLISFAKSFIGREYYNQGMILTIPELAALAHIPNESIETPAVDWNFTQSGARIPADAEQFSELDTEEHSPAPEPADVTEDGVEGPQTAPAPDGPEGGVPPTAEEQPPVGGSQEPQSAYEKALEEQRQIEQKSGILTSLARMLGLANEGAGVQPAFYKRDPGSIDEPPVGNHPENQTGPSGHQGQHQQPQGAGMQGQHQQNHHQQGHPNGQNQAPNNQQADGHQQQNQPNQQTGQQHGNQQNQHQQNQPAQQGASSGNAPAPGGEPVNADDEFDDMEPLGDPAEEGGPTEDKDRDSKYRDSDGGIDPYADVDELDTPDRAEKPPEGWDDDDGEEDDESQ